MIITVFMQSVEPQKREYIGRHPCRFAVVVSGSIPPANSDDWRESLAHCILCGQPSTSYTDRNRLRERAFWLSAGKGRGTLKTNKKKAKKLGSLPLYLL
jgi:hypothetical protein